MENDGMGWKLFAGVMILIGGTFNLIDGLVGITNVNAIKETRIGSQLPLTDDIKTWSWVILIIGVVMILGGFLIFIGNMFGRVVGVAAASINAILQLAYMNHNPFWSLTMVFVDVLVIYALVAHGGKFWEPEETV